jgi:Icc protein
MRGSPRTTALTSGGIPSRYYARDIEGLQLLVLDGNDAGSPTYKGGYVSYVGKEQVEWLKEQIAPRIRDREFMRVST